MRPRLLPTQRRSARGMLPPLPGGPMNRAAPQAVGSGRLDVHGFRTALDTTLRPGSLTGPGGRRQRRAAVLVEGRTRSLPSPTCSGRSAMVPTGRGSRSSNAAGRPTSRFWRRCVRPSGCPSSRCTTVTPQCDVNRRAPIGGSPPPPRPLWSPTRRGCQASRIPLRRRG